jgi:hypothetical protein
LERKQNLKNQEIAFQDRREGLKPGGGRFQALVQLLSTCTQPRLVALLRRPLQQAQHGRGVGRAPAQLPFLNHFKRRKVAAQVDTCESNILKTVFHLML